jgi:hypothetical protein
LEAKPLHFGSVEAFWLQFGSETTAFGSAFFY